MTGDTTPQRQAVEALVAKFIDPEWSSRPLAPLSPRGLSSMARFTASDGHRSIRPLNFGEIVDCLAAAGLLCSSPVLQPEQDEEGSSLRSSKPPAAGRQWAVLREGDGVIFDDESTARSVQWMRLDDDVESDYRLYEIREVDGG